MFDEKLLQSETLRLFGETVSSPDEARFIQDLIVEETISKNSLLSPNILVWVISREATKQNPPVYLKERQESIRILCNIIQELLRIGAEADQIIRALLAHSRAVQALK